MKIIGKCDKHGETEFKLWGQGIFTCGKGTHSGLASHTYCCTKCEEEKGECCGPFYGYCSTCDGKKLPFWFVREENKGSGLKWENGTALKKKGTN